MIGVWLWFIFLLIIMYNVYGWFAPIPYVCFVVIILYYKWRLYKKKKPELERQKNNEDVERLISLQNKYSSMITRYMNNNVKWKRYYDKELQEFIGGGATDQEIDDFKKYNRFAVSIRNNESQIELYKAKFDEIQEEIVKVRGY